MDDKILEIFENNPGRIISAEEIRIEIGKELNLQTIYRNLRRLMKYNPIKKIGKRGGYYYETERGRDKNKELYQCN